MQVNPLKPVHKVVIDGTTYKLVADFESIATAEEVLDKPLICGINPKDLLKPRIALIRALFYALALREHPEMTPAQAKHLVRQDTFADAYNAVVKAWIESQPDPEPEDADEDPKQDQK